MEAWEIESQVEFPSLPCGVCARGKGKKVPRPWSSSELNRDDMPETARDAKSPESPVCKLACKGSKGVSSQPGVIGSLAVLPTEYIWGGMVACKNQQV